MEFITLAQLSDVPVTTKDEQEAGSVRHFYMDEAAWVIRYLQIKPDASLGREDVLLTPANIRHYQPDRRTIILSIDHTRLKNSPSLDFSNPITRSQEEEILNFYEQPLYWQTSPGGIGFGGNISAVPMIDLQADLHEQSREADQAAQGQPSLLRLDTLIGYHLLDSEGTGVGVVDDVLINPENWEIPVMMLDDSSWTAGTKWALLTDWVERISSSQGLVYLGLSKAELEQIHPIEPDQLIDRKTIESLQKRHPDHNKYGGPVE